MSAVPRSTSGVDRATSGLAAAGSAWLAFWFTPADPRPLAMVRILTGLLGLALAGSYAADLEAWFGPGGMLPASVAGQSGPPPSLFAVAASPFALKLLFGVLVAAIMAVTLGLAGRLACLVAAVLWAGLLNRGPVLVGPADDCLAVLLWCLVVGPSGAVWSLDRWIGCRRGAPPPTASPWGRVALGLVRVHAVAIAVSLLLAQLKGDAWWDGTAAWWLTARSQSRLVDLTGLYRGSEYLMNLVTHAIVAFEILFAGGLWFDATRRIVARVGIVAWPLVGILAGEPFWGLALAIFCVPDAFGSDEMASRCRQAASLPHGLGNACAK
ncbi:MAG: hypothetical protein ACKO1M_03205 [Planctomycetota bacterium]